MGKNRSLIIKVVVRIVISAVFAAIWYNLTDKERSVDAPLVFFGVLYIAAAWFTYLRLDGLKFFTATKHDLYHDLSDEDLILVRLGITANLISAFILIGVSFVF